MPLGSVFSGDIDSFILLIQKKHLLSTYYIIRICSKYIEYNKDTFLCSRSFKSIGKNIPISKSFQLSVSSS